MKLSLMEKKNVRNVKENQNIALFMSPAFVTDNFEKGRHNDNNHTKITTV